MESIPWVRCASGNVSFHPPSAANLDSTWPRGCLLDCSTSKEATCSSPTFFSLTGLAVCTPFLSSARMQLLLETGIAVGFLIFQLSDFLRQNATFVFAENKCKCICQAVHFIFLLCRGSPIRVSPNGGRPFSGAQKVVVFTLAA